MSSNARLSRRSLRQFTTLVFHVECVDNSKYPGDSIYTSACGNKFQKQKEKKMERVSIVRKLISVGRNRSQHPVAQQNINDWSFCVQNDLDGHIKK